MLGERLSALVPFEALKLAAGITLLCPFIPLLFMGEEYGEEAPFLYFVSHSDPELVEAVRKGRKNEFSSFVSAGEPPDPQAEGTFLKSKLKREKMKNENNQTLLKFYTHLIAMRKKIPALLNLDKESLDVIGFEDKKALLMRRWDKDRKSELCAVFNFNTSEITLPLSLPTGKWGKILDSSDSLWNGPGTELPDSVISGQNIFMKNRSFVVYLRKETI